MLKTAWPVKTLGEVATIATGKIDVNAATEDGAYPFFTCSRDVYRIDDAPFEGKAILVAGNGDLNVKYYEGRFNAYQRTYFLFARDENKCYPRYLFWFLENHLDVLRSGASGSTIKYIRLGDLSEASIAVPPLEEQKRIVALLDNATARVTELTACYEQARTHANDLLESSFLELFADAFESHPKRKMGEVLQIARGGSPRPISEYITKSPKGVNWIKIGDASSSTKYIYETAQKIKPEGVSRSRMVYPGDFLLSNSMSFGRPYIMKTEGCIHDGWLVLRDSKGELDQDFLFYLLGSRFMYEKFSQLAAGSTVQNLNSALVSSVEIPVPPIDFQKRIAEKARLLEENVARLSEVNKLRLQHANDLRQSILEAAFAGEL